MQCQAPWHPATAAFQLGMEAERRHRAAAEGKEPGLQRAAPAALVLLLMVGLHPALHQAVRETGFLCRA